MESQVVDCWRVTRNPDMTLLMDCNEQRRFDDCGFDQLALIIYNKLRASGDAKLVMICDLTAEGNEFGPGTVISYVNFVNGAILGITNCLFVLSQNRKLWDLLLESPDRLWVGTIEEGKISFRSGKGAKMIDLLRN